MPSKLQAIFRRNRALWPIVLMSILLGIGFYIYPWVFDDLRYRVPFREYLLNNGSFHYSDVFAAFKETVVTQNSRLANLVMYHLVLLPDWLTVVFAATAVGCSVWIGLKLINKQKSLVVSMLLCAAFALLMPWRDHMFVIDFQLNYIWGTLLSLVLCYILLHADCRWPFLFIFALITASWQECSGLPTMIGVTVLSMVYKRFRNPRFYAVFTGLFLGLIWLWISPGGQNYRVSEITEFTLFSPGINIFFIPILLYAGICAMRIYKRTLTDIQLLLLTMGLTTCIIAVKFTIGPRIFWQGDMAAFIGICSCLKVNTTKLKITSIALYIIMCLHLGVVIIQCNYMRIKYDVIVNQLLHRKSTEKIFADFENNFWLQLFSLEKPIPNIFTHYFYVQCFDEYYNGNTDLEKMCRIVPRQLEGVRSTDGVAIDGDEGFRIVNNCIIGTSVADYPCVIQLTSKYGDCERTEDFYVVPFTTVDGKQMAWYHPDRTSILQMMRPHPSLLKFQ